MIRSQIFRFLVSVLFSISIVSSVYANDEHGKPKEKEPVKEQPKAPEVAIPKTFIYRALFKAQDTKIGKAPGCAELVDNPLKRGTHEKNPTLGEWMSHILSQVKDLEKFYSVANCDADKSAKSAPKEDVAGRLCKVRFGKNTGDNVWSWGVNFRLDEEMTIIKDTISCDAAG
jgi:hypothetical protein